MLDRDQIGNKNNYDDVFLRDLTAAFVGQFRNALRWVNEFQDERREVIVPINYSLTGSPRYLYDLFVPSIPACDKPEGDTLRIPSGWVTMEGITIKTQEMNNPNVFVKLVEETVQDRDLRGVYASLKPVPIRINYKLTVLFNSVLDLFKFTESALTWFHAYRFFTFMYKNLKIEGIFIFPDSFENEMPTEIDAATTPSIKTSLSFTVDTFFPIFGGKSYDRAYRSYTDDGPVDTTPKGKRYPTEEDGPFDPVRRTDRGHADAGYPGRDRGQFSTNEQNVEDIHNMPDTPGTTDSQWPDSGSGSSLDPEWYGGGTHDSNNPLQPFTPSNRAPITGDVLNVLFRLYDERLRERNSDEYKERPMSSSIIVGDQDSLDRNFTDDELEQLAGDNFKKYYKDNRNITLDEDYDGDLPE